MEKEEATIDEIKDPLEEKELESRSLDDRQVAGKAVGKKVPPKSQARKIKSPEEKTQLESPSRADRQVAGKAVGKNVPPKSHASEIKGPAEEKLQSRTRADLYTAGKALRNKVPRRSHAGWKAHIGRLDPIDVLIESSKGRIEQLVPIRYGRMMQTPFTFYRGAAAIMAGDLAQTPVTGVRVQACGDCHLLNFGGYATPERRIVFDMNDFDETLPAPWEWDVKRLAASFVVAGRNNNLKKRDCRDAAAMAVRGYRERTAELAARPALQAWYSFLDYESLIEMSEDPVLRKKRKAAMGKAVTESSAEVIYPKLVDQAGETPRIKDDPALIFHTPEQKDPGWEQSVQERIAKYRQSLPDSTRVLLDQYRRVDSAIKVVGVGSVGTTCAVLLLVATDDDPLFLQAKEARVSVLEPYAGKSIYKDRGQRVVVGQRIMQAASDIFLGWVTDRQGRHFYLRQLRDAKFSPMVEIFHASHMIEFAKFCGWALAAAHARSGQSSLLSGYMGSGANFDDAIADFAEAYADQNEKDHAALVKAVRSGRLKAVVEK